MVTVSLAWTFLIVTYLWTPAGSSYGMVPSAEYVNQNVCEVERQAYEATLTTNTATRQVSTQRCQLTCRQVPTP